MLNSCPECGSIDIAAYDTCHTWGGDESGKGWMSCQGCGTALHIFCCEDDCDWSYDWGLNPKNPRSVREEQYRPAWLKGDFNDGVPEGWYWPAKAGVARPLDSPVWDEYDETVRNDVYEWRAKNV